MEDARQCAGDGERTAIRRRNARREAPAVVNPVTHHNITFRAPRGDTPAGPTARSAGGGEPTAIRQQVDVWVGSWRVGEVERAALRRRVG